VHCTTQGVTGQYVCSSDVICSTTSSPVKKKMLFNIKHYSTPSQPLYRCREWDPL